jgi:hypothetical protein
MGNCLGKLEAFDVNIIQKCDRVVRLISVFLKKNNMKKINLFTALVVLLFTSIPLAHAQSTLESTTALTKDGKKGFLLSLNGTVEKGVEIIYKIGGDKKKNELFYESYTFDNALKPIGVKSISEHKVIAKEDREVTYMSAWVGGSTSFDVLSMKLKVNITKQIESWDNENQQYTRSKLISDETTKIKTDDAKIYFGVYQNEQTYPEKLLVLAYYEMKELLYPIIFRGFFGQDCYKLKKT